MEQLKKEQWADLFVMDAERSNFVDTISFRKEPKSKLRQVLSDEQSNRKRKARDNFFGELRHHCLLSRYVAHMKKQRSAKSTKS